MYVQKPLAELDVGVMHDHIDLHAFGTLVLPHDGFFDANHIPFELDRAEGALGTLRAHVSRANPAWRHLSGDPEVLVVIQGNHSYMSPALHPARNTHGLVTLDCSPKYPLEIPPLVIKTVLAADTACLYG
jgi:transcriptional regulator